MSYPSGWAAGLLIGLDAAPNPTDLTPVVVIILLGALVAGMLILALRALRRRR
jgi:hypothetical protein